VRKLLCALVVGAFSGSAVSATLLLELHWTESGVSLESIKQIERSYPGSAAQAPTVGGYVYYILDNNDRVLYQGYSQSPRTLVGEFDSAEKDQNEVHFKERDTGVSVLRLPYTSAVERMAVFELYTQTAFSREVEQMDLAGGSEAEVRYFSDVASHYEKVPYFVPIRSRLEDGDGQGN